MFLFLINSVLFNLLFIIRIKENVSKVPKKLFPILIINQHIKKHVTLKTGVMMLKKKYNRISHILKHIKIGNQY